jgi:hypothetical protein
MQFVEPSDSDEFALRARPRSALSAALIGVTNSADRFAVVDVATVEADTTNVAPITRFEVV